MQVPLQIAVRDTTLSEATEALIRRYAEKLEVFYGRVTACRVMVEVPQEFRGGRPIAYRVRIDLTVPGREIVVGRRQHAEVETAIQRAFDATRRRLQRHAGRRRSAVKHPA